MIVIQAHMAEVHLANVAIHHILERCLEQTSILPAHKQTRCVFGVHRRNVERLLAPLSFFLEVGLDLVFYQDVCLQFPVYDVGWYLTRYIFQRAVILKGWLEMLL